MASTVSAPGLTTGHAPFVEDARSRGDLYIHQAYDQYSEENQEAWRKLYARIQPRWERYANDHFRRGVEALALPADRIPRLSEINQRLQPLTGFQAKAVSGYVPGFLFFDCLRRREFPTTITIRPVDRMDYLPEPDIFHDIAGHVPMHTSKAFADTLVRFGDCAHTAARMTADIRDEAERASRLTSIIRALSRFFWFTVEFGLMRGGPGGVCAYGSGLLSSYGELQHAINVVRCGHDRGIRRNRSGVNGPRVGAGTRHPSENQCLLVIFIYRRSGQFIDNDVGEGKGWSLTRSGLRNKPADS